MNFLNWIIQGVGDITSAITSAITTYKATLLANYQTLINDVNTRIGTLQTALEAQLNNCPGSINTTDGYVLNTPNTWLCQILLRPTNTDTNKFISADINLDLPSSASTVIYIALKDGNFTPLNPLTLSSVDSYKQVVGYDSTPGNVLPYSHAQIYTFQDDTSVIKPITVNIKLPLGGLKIGSRGIALWTRCATALTINSTSITYQAQSPYSNGA